MAINLSGVNYARTSATPLKLIPQGEQNGRVKVCFDTYKGAVALNDVIGMMKLPKGARIVEAVLNHASLGAAGLFKVGFEGTVYKATRDGSDPTVTLDSGSIITHSTKNEAICKAMTTIAGQAAQNAKLVDATGKETVEAQVVVTCTEAPTNADVELELAVYFVID